MLYDLGRSNEALQAFPPAIMDQPQNQTVLAGQMASFTVTATGAQPLDYQWQLNGTDLLGALTEDRSPPPWVQAPWEPDRRWIPQPLTGTSGKSASSAGWRSSHRCNSATSSNSARSA